MKKIAADIIAKKVDEKASQLLLEFQGHVEEVVRENPTFDDKGIIFEGWIVQKVAGLQCLVIELSERIAQLESSQKR